MKTHILLAAILAIIIAPSYAQKKNVAPPIKTKLGF